MLIREFIDKNKIKLEGSWQQFDADFRKAIEGVTDTLKLHTIVRANKKNLEKYHEADEKGWAHLMADLWDQAFGKWQTNHSDSPWAVAESAEDVKYILGLLRDGILVEDAADALYDVLGYNELFEEIALATAEMPRTNFADQLANFIVKLPPKNDAIKDMQNAIMHDAELAAMIVPPAPVKEGLGDNIVSYVEALHEDLKFLKTIGNLNEATAKVKTFIRATQANITTEDMSVRYIKKFGTNNLIESDNLHKAVFSLLTRLKEGKKNNTIVTSAQQTHTIYETAVKFSVNPAHLESRFKELYVKKQETRKAPKTDWAIRYFTNEAQVLDFPKKQHSVSLSHLIDTTEKILPSGSEIKWHDALAQKFGEKFANWYSSLMRISDYGVGFAKYGQNEREIADYLKRNQERDKDMIAIANEHIQDIVTLAKSIGLAHADAVRKEMGEAVEPVVFGRKKAPITIKKKSPEEIAAEKAREEEETKKLQSIMAKHIAKIKGPEAPKEEPKPEPIEHIPGGSYLGKQFNKADAEKNNPAWLSNRYSNDRRIGQTHHDLYQDRELADRYADWNPANAPHTCPNCDGSGETPGRPDSKCSSCKGTGIIESYTTEGLKESVLLAVKRIIEGDHWLSAVEGVALGNPIREAILTKKLIQLGIVEAEILPFARPTKTGKPNHLAYLAAWAKEFIDNEVEIGHIKSELDAEDLYQSIMDRVGIDTNVEHADEWDAMMIRFDKEFSRLFGMPTSDYISQKRKSKSSVNESFADKDLLYHGTSFDSALKIIKANTIMPKTKHVIAQKNVEGVSLSKNLETAKKYGAVIFVMNSKELEANFKVYEFGTAPTATKAAKTFSEEFLVGALKNVDNYIDKILIKHDVLEHLKAKPEYKALTEHPKIVSFGQQNEAQVLDFKPSAIEKSIAVLKDFIDKVKISTDQDVDKLIAIVEKEEDRLGISYEDYSAAFAKKYGMKIMPYIDHKAINGFKNQFGESAQILSFPGRKHPHVKSDWEPNLEIHSSDSLEFFCEKMKAYVDKTDFTKLGAKDDIIQSLDAGLHAIRVEPKEFYTKFHEMFGEDFGLYYLHKADLVRDSMHESVQGQTAHRARVDIARMLRQYVDSSDINLLSNFESYEDQKYLSLKLNVHQDSARKLQVIVNDMIENLKEDGFKEKPGNTMVKGEIMLKLKPIRKTFRTGPYKNRETPTWGIEIIGPKRFKAKRD